MSRQRRLHALLIAAIVVLLFRDALHIPVRADQLAYLHRTAWYEGLWELTIGAFAFNRTDWVGDTLLFRPVLYQLLGLERWLWGYDSRLWQATSIALHVAVVLALHRYLWRLLPAQSWLASLAALWFGVLYASVEMVAWDHVAGYLLFCLLVLLGAHAVKSFVESCSARAALAAFAAALAAAFTYELGGAFALAMAGWVLASRRALPEGAPRSLALRLAAGLALVPLLYAAWSGADYFVRFGVPLAVTGSDLPGVPLGLLHTVAWWTWVAAVPAGLELIAGPRVVAAPVPALDMAWVVFNFLVSAAGVATLALVVFQRAQRREMGLASHWFPALAFAALAGAYALVIVLGRGADRGYELILMTNTYYTYVFVLFGMLSVAHLLATRPDEVDVHPARMAPLALALVVSCAISFHRVSDVLADMRLYHEQQVLLLAEIAKLHAAHAGEPGFTFSVEPGCRANRHLRWFQAHAKVPLAAHRVSNLLYPFTAREQGGKHLVPCPPEDRIGP